MNFETALRNVWCAAARDNVPSTERRLIMSVYDKQRSRLRKLIEERKVWRSRDA